jgi:hypothetical protein
MPIGAKMATAQEITSGSQDMANFQMVIQQLEGIFGPVISLSASGGNNVMTFQVGPSPDSQQRAILETFADHPPQRTDASLICVGTCFVSAVAQKVAAYRPSA